MTNFNDSASGGSLLLHVLAVYVCALVHLLCVGGVFWLGFVWLGGCLSGRGEVGLFVQFAACAFRKLLSIYVHVFSYFPFCFEGTIWDLIVSVPDHCLPFYFPMTDTAFSSSKLYFNCDNIHLPNNMANPITN